MNKPQWYDLGRILSYKRPLNIIVGIRGHGKTYSTKKYCLKRYEKNRERFIYIRRYDSQLKKSKAGFMDDIGKDPEIKGHYAVSGDYLYALPSDSPTSPEKIEIAGYFMTLSTYDTYKSSSYAAAKNVIFDEFITSEKYVNNEYFKFSDLCETIIRHRDGKIFMLSNALSVANPYFEAWGINKLDREFIKTDDMVIHNDNSKTFAEFKRSTTIGRIFGRTAWAAYAYDNEFALDNPAFLGEPQGSKETVYNLMLNGRRIGIYYCRGLIYCGKPFEGKTFSPYVDDVANNSDVILIDKKDLRVYNIYKWYTRNECMYQNQTTKNEIVLLCRRIGRNY